MDDTTHLLVEFARNAFATLGSCLLFPAPLLWCCLERPVFFFFSLLIYCFIGPRQEASIWKSVRNSLWITITGGRKRIAYQLENKHPNRHKVSFQQHICGWRNLCEFVSPLWYFMGTIIWCVGRYNSCSILFLHHHVFHIIWFSRWLKVTTLLWNLKIISIY